MKSNFADRAKISQVGADEITIATANGFGQGEARES